MKIHPRICRYLFLIDQHESMLTDIQFYFTGCCRVTLWFHFELQLPQLQDRVCADFDMKMSAKCLCTHLVHNNIVLTVIMHFLNSVNSFLDGLLVLPLRSALLASLSASSVTAALRLVLK